MSRTTARPLALVGLLTIAGLVGVPARVAASPQLEAQIAPAATALAPDDNDGDGIPDALEQQLAEQFAPVIYIHPQEANYPANVDWFLARAGLEYFEDCFPDVEESIPGAPSPIGSQESLIGPPWVHPDSWGSGHDERHCGDPPDHRRIATTAPDPESYSDQVTFVLPDVSDANKRGSLDPSDWRTYVHVYPNASGGIQIQYWHVFAYNAFDFAGFGNHGGDWDASIQVVLDSSLNPTSAWFSRHGDDHPGDLFSWSSLSIYQGTHPQVAIDRGGHAAFRSFQDCQDYFEIVFGLSICSISWRDDPDGPGFGTVWKTWTGGQVRQDPSQQPFPNTYSITPNPGVTGGIVNLGEYNPGERQASAILSGQFQPLNGQIFTRYSGRWGSIGLIFSGPRGPVFQGFDSGVYRSWYNQAASAPATATSHPWRQAPNTSLTVGTPRFDSGTSVYVAPQTTFSLTASENAVAAARGAATTYYRITRVGSAPGGFSQYAQPFSIAGTDGAYRVDVYSVDSLGNAEAQRSSTFVLDATVPQISITAPTTAAYEHPSFLTLAYGADDGQGSGVTSVTATLDGATSVAGQAIQPGLVVDLLNLSLGAHAFAVSAADRLGNGTTSTVTFTIIATPESLRVDLARFLQNGAIGDKLSVSLRKKLDAADAARARSDCLLSNRIYQSLIDELVAQSGKEVDAQAAATIIGDVQYVMGLCP